MKSFVITVFSGMFLLISGQALAGNPAFPKLAGQYETYLEKTLIAYKTGERENAIMSSMAAALSKEDIENLSVYYSSQSGLATKK
jgi:cytochrome c553